MGEVVVPEEQGVVEDHKNLQNPVPMFVGAGFLCFLEGML